MMATSQPSGSFDICPTLAGRAKALGLAALYFAVVAGAVVAVSVALGDGAHRSLPRQLLLEWAYLASAMLALAACVVFTRESMSRWGFALQGVRRNFLLGLATGFALMAGSLAAIALLGGCSISGVAAPLGRMVSVAACYALLDLGVGFFEETFFRSFMLVQLSRAVGFWPAAVITAILFGLAHGGNPHEAAYGLVVASLAGFALACSFRRSGTLWFAIGWHAAYDFTEDFIFGVPDSGNALPQASLLHTTMHGPAWLTGGQIGPEASLLTLAALLGLALVIRFALPPRVPRTE